MTLTDCPEFLTIDQLGELLQIPVGTIYQRNSRATMPPRVKIGRTVRYHRDDVAAWLEAQRVA